ncbi:hypothetical protein ACLOJK_031154 [Asimina triloba]
MIKQQGSDDPRHAGPLFFRPLLRSSSFLARNSSWTQRIFDPRSLIITRWNRFFLVSCLVALFVDPLYFLIPNFVPNSVCLHNDEYLRLVVTIFRSVADLIFLTHIILKFRTAFIAPTSRVFGRGDLVMDPKEIAMHYLKKDFVIDLAAMLPLPQACQATILLSTLITLSLLANGNGFQGKIVAISVVVVVWIVIPAVKSSTIGHNSNTLALIVLIQYVPRLLVMFPLNRRIVKSTGIVTTTAWGGAAYNLLLYMLASHVLGACWYVLSIDRQRSCLLIACSRENGTMSMPLCKPRFLDCHSLDDTERFSWLNNTQVFNNCDLQNADLVFDYGMFAEGVSNEVFSTSFPANSYGQGLMASTKVTETSFCILICITGLVLFAHLIGQMQTFLQSTNVRLEESRVKRRDTEEWMRHRQLPEDLQERVWQFLQFQWIATRGVDEESILWELPLDIRRDIQRHLCLALVRRVPFFSKMDDQLLDAICERLVSSLSTQGTYIVREGDPVNEMLFIIRGQLESSTTDGGRSGFFNCIALKPGDFCGEELLTWALMPTSSLHLPCSTRTVRSVSQVEAFALRAEDLKFVANQFKRLHSKKLQHAFRHYSHQWRTWGACYIQAGWRRYKKRKLAKELAKQESLFYMPLLDEDEDEDEEYGNEYDEYDDGAGPGPSTEETQNHQQLGVTILASKFAKNTKRGANQKMKQVNPSAASLKLPKLLKPDEPDFSC